MTPAEHAAMSDGPTQQDTVLDRRRPQTAVIEVDEHPATVVIELPEDGHVDPSSD
jgi:hypothetical protein